MYIKDVEDVKSVSFDADVEVFGAPVGENPRSDSQVGHSVYNINYVYCNQKIRINDNHLMEREVPVGCFLFRDPDQSKHSRRDILVEMKGSSEAETEDCIWLNGISIEADAYTACLESHPEIHVFTPLLLPICFTASIFFFIFIHGVIFLILFLPSLAHDLFALSKQSSPCTAGYVNFSSSRGSWWFRRNGICYTHNKVMIWILCKMVRLDHMDTNVSEQLRIPALHSLGSPA